jgi:hypothetical protein
VLRRRKAVTVLGVPLALLSLLLSASVTVAQTTPCWGGFNDGAWAALPTHTSTNGTQGDADSEAATPHNPSTTGIVHPSQIAMSSGDFVGWGTTKGVGTNDPTAISNCPTYTGTLWYLYVDGYSFGRYFCRQTYGSLPSSFSNQHWLIRYSSCSGSTRWAFWWNSTLKTCQAVSGDRGAPGLGGESIGYDPQHIDSRQHALQYHVSNWASWTSDNTTCTNPDYRVVKHSNTDYTFEEL